MQIDELAKEWADAPLKECLYGVVTALVPDIKLRKETIKVSARATAWLTGTGGKKVLLRRTPAQGGEVSDLGDGPVRELGEDVVEVIAQV